MRRFLCLMFFVFFAGFAFQPMVHAKEKDLYRFSGGTDGSFPSSSLVRDAAGNLYGTTGEGGDLNQCSESGCGTVFELMPSAGGLWQERVLYAFEGGSDGAFPSGNLVLDTLGNLYGTTSFGGSATCDGGCGTVFELSPDPHGAWTETVLYSFQGDPDGYFPTGLIFDLSGNLYGTSLGGAKGSGMVYLLEPPKGRDGSWSEKILYNFSAKASPNPVLVFDDHGNLYGTYYNPRVSACLGAGNCGAVFELKHAHGKWSETDLYHFLGGGNGGQPMTGVIRDSDGNLYGTGVDGGNRFGFVFELKRSGAKWKEIMLHNFCSRNNCADGAVPYGGLAMDGSGRLYGTTFMGGLCWNCPGVVFKLAYINNRWKEVVLHAFRGGSDEGTPSQTLILDGQGNLYGTATSEGTNLYHGAVFEVMP